MSTIVDLIFESPVFETDRLTIGRWHPDLAELAFEIYGDAEIARWLSGTPEESVDSMRDRLHEVIERNNRWPECWGSWPMFLTQDRGLVGALLMKPLPDENGDFTSDIEIGWHLARRHWGSGYATEGGRHLIDIAFNELGLSELSAVTNPHNRRSQNVARRLGMNYQGQTEAYYGQTLDLFKICSSRSED